jgi:hypothetical protein
MNNLLLVCAIVLVFSLLLIAKKLFGKSGVIGFMGLATIAANIMVCKSVTLLGLSATLGNVMFASNFLATDILTECYGVGSAKKGVRFAIFSIISFCVCTQIMLAFTPSEIDVAQESMQALFSLAPRITLASVAMFALANMVDVKLYEHLRKKTDGELMWLRNNLSTIVCNGMENFAFYFIAFAGIFDTKALISMGVTATVIEIAIALCDTPFLYVATKEERSNKQRDLRGA